MKLSEFKNLLSQLETLVFRLENGNFIPDHFHITEVGLITRNFIDCGGTIRETQKINFQIWTANDFEHRLKPQKLLNIIRLSESKLSLPDVEIEVEYQLETIGKFDLDFDGKVFWLKNSKTACLAEDSCGIPQEKLPNNCCGSNCC